MTTSRAAAVLLAGILVASATSARAMDDAIVKKQAGAGLVLIKPTPTPHAPEQDLAALRSPAARLAGAQVATRSPAGQAKARAVTQLISNESAAASSLRSAKDSFGSDAVRQNKSFKAAALKLEPGISDVNRKTAGFILAPGGYLTIDGYDFGDGMGQVNVIGGGLPSGALALRVVDWHTGQIYAFLPGPLRGLLDQDVALQVVTRDGKTYRLNGGKFVATREEVTITNGIGRLVRVYGAPPIVGMGVGSEDGHVFRETVGKNIACFQPGQDVLAMVDPGRGFVVVGLSFRWGRTDSGDRDGTGSAGNRMFFPGYSFGDWYTAFPLGDCIKVKWGVWRSHHSPSVFGDSAQDWCQSSYQVSSVTLSGPAGVAPF
jgi:hypothetical protein